MIAELRVESRVPRIKTACNYRFGAQRAFPHRTHVLLNGGKLTAPLVKTERIGLGLTGLSCKLKTGHTRLSTLDSGHSPQSAETA